MKLSHIVRRSKKWIQKAVPESRRGVFTAKAKAHGERAQEYAAQVLAPGSKADTTTKREAVFARRAKKGF